MRHTRTLAVLTLAGAVLLTACTADPQPEATPATSQAAASPAAPTAEATPEPTATPVPAAVACLESGEWVVDNEQIAAQEAEDLAMVGSSPAVTYTGESAHSFAAGSYTRTFTAWQNDFSVISSAGGSELVVQSTLDGTTTAAYTATEDRIEIAAADVSGLSVAYSATSNGAPLDPAENVEAITARQAEADTWAYTCADGVLTLQYLRTDGTVSEYGSRVLRQR